MLTRALSGPGSVGALPSKSQLGPAATEEAGGSFAELLAKGLSETARSVHAAEATSVAGLNGDATVQQVVEAVMGAEQRLQLAIGVRDKVVAAYLEISRMQI